MFYFKYLKQCCLTQIGKRICENSEIINVDYYVIITYSCLSANEVTSSMCVNKIMNSK